MDEHPRVGRPRDPEVDGRVLGAAFEIMSEVGFRGLRADALAARSGVPKSTIYRRWSSLADLAVDAVDARLGPRTPVATDDPLADVASLITLTHGILTNAGLVHTLPQLAHELIGRPDAAEAYRTRVVGPLRDGAIAAVDRAAAAGLWDGPDAATSVDLLIGMLLYRATHLGRTPSLDDCFAVADVIAGRPLPRGRAAPGRPPAT